MSIKRDFPEHSRIIIVALSGIGDAVNSGTEALRHLIATYDHKLIAAIDDEDFYDYHIARATFGYFEYGRSEIVWPSVDFVRLTIPELPTTEIILVTGHEPSLKWRTFVRRFFELIPTGGHTMVLTLGAMFTEMDYRRPFEVQGHSKDPVVNELTGYAPREFDIDTGLTGVIALECEARGLSTAAIWSHVPNYLGSSACPKTSLALLRTLEEILAITLNTKALEDATTDWQLAVDELVADDEDLAHYLDHLVGDEDISSLSETSGEEIAKEFSRYLRRPKR
jgi:hypothetical protein